MDWDVYDIGERVQFPESILKCRNHVLWLQRNIASTWVIKLTMTPSDLTIVDLARSTAYRKCNAPGAYYASSPNRARDLKALPSRGPIILTSPNGEVAAANLHDARAALPDREVSWLANGTAAWTAAGLPLEPSADGFRTPSMPTNDHTEARTARKRICKRASTGKFSYCAAG